MDDETRLEFQQRLFAGHRGDRAAQLYETLVSNGPWLSPTLTVLKYLSYMGELAESDANTEALLYLPSEYAQNRISQAEDTRENRPDAQQELANRQFQFNLRVVGDMHKAGVKLIAGTDSSAFCFPGCTLHDELELLVEAGLSPLAALQAATINAAEFSGRLDDFGTLAEGKTADLVLLEANPLAGIRNTSRISAVVLNEVFYDKSALDAMLTEVRILPANYRP